jgi:hypothetical protein
LISARYEKSVRRNDILPFSPVAFGLGELDAAATGISPNKFPNTRLAHGADERAPDDAGKPPIVYAATGA